MTAATIATTPNQRQQQLQHYQPRHSRLPGTGTYHQPRHSRLPGTSAEQYLCLQIAEVHITRYQFKYLVKSLPAYFT